MAYYVAADSEGRVMSTCNSGNNEVMVTYLSLTFQPGLYYLYALLWGNHLATFSSLSEPDQTALTSFLEAELGVDIL